jgi:heat shock protein HslJ
MAAGLGFKTFTTGEVLTAADTNGYLMQGVNVFADAAARTAAITSPEEGQMSYLKDTNSTEYYTGSAWVAIGGGGAPANGTSLVATNQSTTSTTYTDLATVQAVTITTGTKALVILSAQAGNTSAATDNFMAFEVSGASTVAPSNDMALFIRDQDTSQARTTSAAYIITGLTAGSNTFTAKYRTSGNTVSFADRSLVVVDMGS